MFPLDTAGIIAADVFKVCLRSWRWFHLEDNQIHAKVHSVSSLSHQVAHWGRVCRRQSQNLRGAARQDSASTVRSVRLHHCFTVPRQPNQFGSKDCQRERMQDESRWIKMNQDESRWIKMNQDESRWIKMNQDESRWIKMNQDESRWIKMNQGESRWVKMNQDESRWIKMNQDESRWIKMNQDESRWIKMNQDESRWIQMNPDESRWIKMNQDESRWIQMNQDESRWIKMNQDESRWIKMNQDEMSIVWMLFHTDFGYSWTPRLYIIGIGRGGVKSLSTVMASSLLWSTKPAPDPWRNLSLDFLQGSRGIFKHFLKHMFSFFQLFYMNSI